VLDRDGAEEDGEIEDGEIEDGETEDGEWESAGSDSLLKDQSPRDVRSQLRDSPIIPKHNRCYYYDCDT
jgi:hypothetical protein